MKKCIALILCLLALLAGLMPAYASEGEKLSVVSTIFPPYDFVREIAGDAVELSMLLPPGSESHSFEPAPQDIIKIQQSDVFVYIGGETDAWVNRILESLDTEHITILPLLDMVDAVPEALVEGMEHGHEHDHGHAEIHLEDIHPRPLSDWAGAWESIAPLAQNGSLDAYLAPLAEENGATFEAQRENQALRWRSDFDAFSIDGDTVTIDGHSAQYADAGHTLVKGDHGESVWYQYTIKAPTEGMPTHLLFSDHKTGGEPEDHDHETLSHTHLRYGDESLSALANEAEWSPYFVEASAAPDAVLAMLTGHSHDHDAEEVELDEHVWTSPQNAMRIVEVLAATLADLDPANADRYHTGAGAYLDKLSDLDAAFINATKDTARKTVVFGDRFPFRYLADDYGLSYYAAFPGCATETEASASTVAFLIDRVMEESIPAVFTIEFSSGKIADTIAESTGAKRLTLHSCHNLSRDDFAAGVTYLDLMHQNADILKEALR